MNNLLFCNMGVPGAASGDVLSYQAPQAHLFFDDTGKTYKKVVTITVGGNDALSLLDPSGNIDLSKVPVMLQTYGNNLAAILSSLISQSTDVRIFVANLYDPRLPIPGADLLVGAMNQVTANVAGYFPSNVTLVDIHAAFDTRSGLLLVERRGAGFNIHPTDAGYRLMANTFADAINGHQ